MLGSVKSLLHASWQSMSPLQLQTGLLRDLHHAQKIVEIIEVPPKMHTCVCSEDEAQDSGKAFMMVS